MHTIRITDVRPTMGDSAFLLDDGKTAILYDTGFAFTGPALAVNVKKVLGERSLDYIFLTHSHYDHFSPEDIAKARSFLNHSLPLLSGILRKYIRLEQSGVPNEDVTAQTISCLQDLETAAQKQYQNLFDNDVVDITADMEVLTQLCRQNGLLEEDLIL